MVYKEGEEDLGGAQLAGFWSEEDLKSRFALIQLEGFRQVVEVVSVGEGQARADQENVAENADEFVNCDDLVEFRVEGEAVGEVEEVLGEL